MKTLGLGFWVWDFGNGIDERMKKKKKKKNWMGMNGNW
jgi:hypothetical protein